MMKYKLFFFLLFCPLLSWANPVDSLLERLDKGASSKFELVVDGSDDSTADYFELSDSHGKVRVRGNSYISIAAGIGWLEQYASPASPSAAESGNHRAPHVEGYVEILPQLLYVVLLDGFLGLGPLAGGNRLDGPSWY